MSLNQSMNISLGSMRNNQYALTVVSQNIANVHVEGYHRQRVNFVTNEYTTKCENVISTIKGMNGASISSLTDYIDDAAFNNLINSNSDANYYNTLADAVQGLEDVADDLGDNGLNGLLNKFYAAAADLEKYPTDMTVRRQYVLAAQNVCEKFNDVSAKYDTIQADKFDTVGLDISRINSLLSKLAEYNELHVKSGKATTTQADINEIVQELSNYMDITTSKNDNGTINLFIGNNQVIQGNQVNFVLEAKYDATNKDNAVSLSLKSLITEDLVITEGVNEAFQSGSMKANLDFLNGSGKGFTNINDVKSTLDIAANAFAQAVNEVQTFGSFGEGNFAACLATAPNGDIILQEANEDMFVAKGGQPFSAGNIAVNDKIIEDPFLVAAARIDLANYKDPNDPTQTDPNWIYSIGNSDNATELSAIQNKKICSYNGGTNNCTLSQFLTDKASQNGMDIANIQSKADTANDIKDMSATNYANLIGVNLDEELADMIKYQRSYEASAKIFTTVNDLMGVIINMV